MIKTHKITNKKFLVKKDYGVVSTLFILDNNGNKIKNGFDINGNTDYKTAICLNSNIN